MAQLCYQNAAPSTFPLSIFKDWLLVLCSHNGCRLTSNHIRLLGRVKAECRLSPTPNSLPA